MADKKTDMTFVDTWLKQFNTLMDYFVVAAISLAIVACFSKKVPIRYFLGSFLFGLGCGAVAAYFTDAPWVPIFFTAAGVATAPQTIAKLSGTTLWDVIDRLRGMHDNTPK